MKNLIRGRDDLYYIFNIKSEQGTHLSPSDVDAFSIDFYTDGQHHINYSSHDDVSPEGILHIDATDLERLNNGALKLRINFSFPQYGFTDGTYDRSIERMTGYFLKSNKIN